MSKNVALLNPQSSDGQVSGQILTVLQRLIDRAESEMLHSKCASYDQYLEGYARLMALRQALQEAQETYDRNFKI